MPTDSSSASAIEESYARMFLGSNKREGSTVEPPKRGHFGSGTFVLSSEVVLFSEVV